MTKLRTVPVPASFFDVYQNTKVTWLGMAGVLINSRGTIILIDPLITDKAESGICECGKRRLIPAPIRSYDVPKADLICYTHADFDHLGKLTAEVINKNLTPKFIAPPPVVSHLKEIGVEENRIIVAKDFASFTFGELEVNITPALHDHQDMNPWKRGDCCGFLIKSLDGTLWHPGDTRLIPELEEVKDVDILFFDVAARKTHLGPEGSARLGKTSGAKRMITYHYGTYDVPAGSFGGCDPNDALPYVEGLSGKLMQSNPGEVLELPLV